MALTPSWASDHISPRDLIRNGNADQLRDTRADRSSRRARPPGSRASSPVKAAPAIGGRPVDQAADEADRYWGGASPTAASTSG